MSKKKKINIEIEIPEEAEQYLKELLEIIQNSPENPKNQTEDLLLTGQKILKELSENIKLSEKEEDENH